MAPENILLSISVLVSNRPKTVEKCLKSLDSLRRRVPSELILVDTGCGEYVRKIIEHYADKIVEFEWCKDFSKARNAGLKQAGGQWLLYLDDDEWFENTDEIEDFFLSGRYLQYNSGVYLVRNYYNLEGTEYHDVYVSRLFRLLPGEQFVYSIHEVFSGPGAPMARLNSYVHHYGYAYKNKEELLQHSRRNIELLVAEHEKDPLELHHILQLAREYNAVEEWEKSIEISWEGIQNAVPGAARDSILGGLYANIVRAYISLKQYKKAAEAGEKYLELEDPNELAKATVHSYLCMAYLEMGEYSKGLEAAVTYEEIRARWKRDRDAFFFYENLFTDYTFSENVVKVVLYRGVRCAIKLGKAGLAKNFFDEIKWNTKKGAVDVAALGMVQDLVRAWLQTDADEARDYTDMMKSLLRDEVLTKVVVTDIDILSRKTPELLGNKRANWAELAKENWIFQYYKLRNRVETNKDTQASAKQNILLSISILISNRPDTIEKCLRSLDSLRRKIPSELILVDTGCGEEVRKIIEPYADKIVEFAWCSDFAKARNAGLNLAKGEWFLYLDDDEWFENTDELEDFFLSDKHLHYNYGTYLQRNYIDPEGRSYRDAYVGRLIRLAPDVEFMYSIHEVFSKVQEPCIRLHCYVHHYGYAFQNEEETKKHSRRNIELLLKEHEKAPGELRHVAQLVQEYNGLEEWEKSIDISWKGIQNADSGITKKQFLGGLYVNIVRNYTVLKQYANAIETGEAYLALDTSDELDRAAVCFNLCTAYLEIEEYAKSLEAAKRYLKFYRKREEDRDATAFYESLAAPFFGEGCKQAVLCEAVRNAIQLGNTALSKQYFEEINWGNKNTLTECEVQDMIQTLMKAWLRTDADRAQDYTAMLRALLKDGMLARIVEKEIDYLRKHSPEHLQTKRADWEMLADANWFFRYFKLRNRIETDRDRLMEDYGKLWLDPTEALMRAGELGLWEMAGQDGVEMMGIISGIPLCRWKIAVGIAAEGLDWQHAQEMQNHLQETLDRKDFRMLYWSIPYRMRKIRIMAEDRDEGNTVIGNLPESIVKELLMYAAENESLYRSLYREELFQERPELLPQGCQVSLKLLDMDQAAEKGDFQQALNDVREALKIMPELSDAMKYCTKWLSEKSTARNTEQTYARDEMKKLAEAVKGQVRNIAAHGLLSEAAGVLVQLKAMVPEDEEVMELEKEMKRLRKGIEAKDTIR